jgi:hypothetical protein
METAEPALRELVQYPVVLDRGRPARAAEQSYRLHLQRMVRFDSFFTVITIYRAPATTIQFIARCKEREQPAREKQFNCKAEINRALAKRGLSSRSPKAAEASPERLIPYRVVIGRSRTFQSAAQTIVDWTLQK